MASSPEQRDIERKARDLKVQEDRLERRAEQHRFEAGDLVLVQTILKREQAPHPRGVRPAVDSLSKRAAATSRRLSAARPGLP